MPVLQGDRKVFEETNWNEEWKKTTLGASWRRRQEDPVAYFDKKAEWYNRVVPKRSDHASEVIPRLAVDHDSTVLDIGSGPGILSVPLAKTVKHVTALDPSSAMLRCLENNAQREGLENITLINKRWEDVDIGKDMEAHDIVIASHSLTMLDLKGALIKMNEASDKAVYLIAGAGKQAWDYLELWPKLYGEPYVPGPDYIFIVNILYQMGIYANMEIWTNDSRQPVSSLDDAVQERLEYFEASLPGAEQVIREHLSRTLVEENGVLMARRKTKTAMIWWQKTRGSQWDAG